MKIEERAYGSVALARENPLVNREQEDFSVER